MKILIAGASGMVGRALVKALSPQHELIVLGRDTQKLNQVFPGLLALKWDELSAFKTKVDLIIHLAGVNIGQSRWTTEFKQKVLASRINTAKQLGQWAHNFDKPPRILAANAVGYYGSHSFKQAFDESSAIDEQSPQGFLQEVAFSWQAVWESFDLNVCIMRFGVVLANNQGMLKKLYPSFYFGAGAILGDGQQAISWIHLADLVAGIMFLIEDQSLTGAVNLVSPNPVTQETFARTFAKILQRPLWLRMPASVVHLLFGQMGQELLLSGQAVYPKRLLDLGFQFQYKELSAALKHEYA
jgi:uncharacterized protein (TIGR01777 family)